MQFGGRQPRTTREENEKEATTRERRWIGGFDRPGIRRWVLRKILKRERREGRSQAAECSG